MFEHMNKQMVIRIQLSSYDTTSRLSLYNLEWCNIHERGTQHASQNFTKMPVAR